MEIYINYKERLDLLKKKYSNDQTEPMSYLHNMSVADYRKAIIEYISHITVKLAGRKVLKLPCGKYDVIEGKDVIDYIAPTVYASILKEEETGLYLSVADESSFFSIKIIYAIDYKMDENDKVSKFDFVAKLYYVRA